VVILATEVLAVAELWKFQFTQDYLDLVGYKDPSGRSSLGFQVGVGG